MQMVRFVGKQILRLFGGRFNGGFIGYVATDDKEAL